MYPKIVSYTNSKRESFEVHYANPLILITMKLCSLKKFFELMCYSSQRYAFLESALAPILILLKSNQESDGRLAIISSDMALFLELFLLKIYSIRRWIRLWKAFNKIFSPIFLCWIFNVNRMGIEFYR